MMYVANSSLLIVSAAITASMLGFVSLFFNRDQEKSGYQADNFQKARGLIESLGALVRQLMVISDELQARLEDISHFGTNINGAPDSSNKTATNHPLDSLRQEGVAVALLVEKFNQLYRGSYLPMLEQVLGLRMEAASAKDPVLTRLYQELIFLHDGLCQAFYRLEMAPPIEEVKRLKSHFVSINNYLYLTGVASQKIFERVTQPSKLA
jgi:hypothetical protein